MPAKKQGSSLMDKTTTPDLNELDDAFNEFAGHDQPNESQDLEDEAGFEDQPAEDNQQPVVDDDEIARLKRERDEWMHKARSDASRVSALTKKQQDLLQQLEQRKTETANSNPSDSGMSDDQWAVFVDEYPELAAAMNSKYQQLERQQQQVAQQLAQLNQSIAPIQQREVQHAYEQQVNALEERHPGWTEVVRTNEFSEWVARQPESMQQYIQSNDANDASYLLDVYKAMTGMNQSTTKPDNGRSNRLRTNIGIKARSGNESTGIPDDLYDAFDYYAS
jgi:hypothetical protein